MSIISIIIIIITITIIIIITIISSHVRRTRPPHLGTPLVPVRVITIAIASANIAAIISISMNGGLSGRLFWRGSSGEALERPPSCRGEAVACAAWLHCQGHQHSLLPSPGEKHHRCFLPVLMGRKLET